MSVFFTGLPVGTCQDALDPACGFYLNDPIVWTRPPTNLRAGPLRLADESQTVIFGCGQALRLLTIGGRSRVQQAACFGADGRTILCPDPTRPGPFRYVR